jgi:translation initiation factor 1 (eIF-1/SUI1)
MSGIQILNFGQEDLFKEFENQINEKIHLHLMAKAGRKCLTVIDGLELSSEDEKKFLKLGKSKFSTTGYKKLMPEYNSKSEVYCFFGDHRNAFVELIKKEYGKQDNVFHIHG